MRSALFAIILALPINAFAQSDPCIAAAPPFVVSSGAPYTVTWLMDAQVPVSPTDPTLVNQRIDGYYLQIDLQTRTRITSAQVTVLPPCSATTPNSGKIPTVYRTTSGVTRGSHTARLAAFNFTLDVNGNPTTSEQEGPAVTVPFDAVDPLQSTPPRIPGNVIIRK
jgi:hypothetical protein